MPKIVCVVPSIRPEQMAKFREAWQPLFEKHKVTLITVWDGDDLRYECDWRDPAGVRPDIVGRSFDFVPFMGDLFCRRTDACRNLGFALAAMTDATHILTMDDDVAPVKWDRKDWSESESKYVPHDPIQAHLDALARRVPLSWMNTAHWGSIYLRGVPYGIREEAPVMLSHGVWVGTPDFDGETQLKLEQERGVPYSLPYYVGPIHRGVLFPLCGMNVMIRREALPYFYFAPMGPDTGITQSQWIARREIDPLELLTTADVESKQLPALNRFADIWMGIFLKRQFDALGWACVTGYSTVLHTRASDAQKNFEQEKLGREWNEWIWRYSDSYDSYVHLLNLDANHPLIKYLNAYADKRDRYAKLIREIMGGQS